MTNIVSPLPKPRAKLLRTWLKWPRSLRDFAPRFDSVAAMHELPDPAEAAHWGEIILAEDHVVAMHRDGTASRLTHVITMPHGNQHLAAWDELPQLYDERKTKVTIRKAVVHIPGNGSRKAKKVVIPASAHERLLKLTFEPLRPGVIVEVEIQEDRFVVDEVGPYLWENLPLQTLFPCKHRRITAAIAEPFQATVVCHHTELRPVESFENGYRVYRWDLHAVPGIEVDDWTPPARDCAPWIDISTLSDWKPISDHYRKELFPTNKIPDAVKNLARELSANAISEREKAFNVYRYASQDVRYGRHPSELEVPKTRDGGKLLEDLRGDCKDKSWLMVTLLGEMKIPAQIVVLLTAINGRTPMLPSRRFDHAIVMATVDGQTMWFDPASGPTTFGDLPINDQGVKALILDKDHPTIVDIPLDDPSRQTIERRCVGQLSTTGEYQFEARIIARGEKAAVYRMLLKDRNDDLRRRTIQQSVAEERPGAEVTNIQLGDLEDIRGPMEYGYSVRLPAWGRAIKDLLLFRIPWAETAEVTGPISASERRHALQLPGLFRLIEKHEIALPEGFQGYGLPYQQQFDSPWAKYSLSVSYEAGKLLCQRTMETSLGILPTEKFGEFKQFWENCARADATDVVLMRERSQS